jgi:hypothetical protein
MSQVFICNLDDRPGALCRGCAHPKIQYVPMAAGFRCDACHTFESDTLAKAQSRAFHDTHAACSAPGGAGRTGDG